MSGLVTGAVFQEGPAVLRPRMVLAAIAEAADDHGFACLSMETIAMKTVCKSTRTAMRNVEWLEARGWLSVVRKAAGDGKGNVYFVNIDRLGVRLNPKSRKNDWHLAFERKYPGLREQAWGRGSGDNMAREPAAEPIESAQENGPSDTMSPDFGGEEGYSGDISGATQVTFPTDSGDISAFPILKNRVNRENRVLRGKRASNPPEPDPRHVPFRLACEVYAKFKGVRFVWDGSETGVLARLLESCPSLTLLDFQSCLTNRARSPGTPHGERPRLWLANITRYQEGPLNQFNRTNSITTGETHGRDLGNRKASAANEALARAQARVVEEDRADGEAAGDVPGPGRGDGRGSLAELLDSA